MSLRRYYHDAKVSDLLLVPSGDIFTGGNTFNLLDYNYKAGIVAEAAPTRVFRPSYILYQYLYHLYAFNFLAPIGSMGQIESMMRSMAYYGAVNPLHNLRTIDIDFQYNESAAKHALSTRTHAKPLQNIGRIIDLYGF